MRTIEKRSEDLVIALLAAIATRGVDTLRMNDRVIHEHFATALESLRRSGRDELVDLADGFYRSSITDTFDELDNSLVTAEQYGFVKFPNPSYSRVVLAFSPRMAHRVLKNWQEDDRKALANAADEFLGKTANSKIA